MLQRPINGTAWFNAESSEQQQQPGHSPRQQSLEQSDQIQLRSRSLLRVLLLPFFTFLSTNLTVTTWPASVNKVESEAKVSLAIGAAVAFAEMQ